MPIRGRTALRTIPILVGLVAAASVAADAGHGTRLLRDPDVGPSGIAFVHANDIWTVNRDGGDAVRLTSAEGAETDPSYSPDGRWIAFTGEYGGNADVFVVPATGGQPVRLTFHPGADVVQGWTPEGRVLFRSGREGKPTKLSRFYTVPTAGGLPQPLALPQAWQGELSGDGAFLAYQEIGFWDPEWRNYRGGQAQPVSVVSTSTWERQTPPWKGERQTAPVWLDDVVYYISERDWAANVWSWDPATGLDTQRTFHTDFDVKSLGAGYGAVVYEQGGYLHELDPTTGATRQLVIRVAGDLNWSRPRWEDVPADQLQDPHLSPTGARALFEYRGDLFTVPAEHGSWRNLTGSSGVADRYPAWSPDGKKIAWFNDRGGEYGLVVADQDGANPRRIDIPDPTFFFTPVWSPDGTKLAFTDTDYRLLVLDLATEEVVHIDTDRYAHPRRSLDPVFSPDSRWIAYSRRLDNQLRAIFLADVAAGTTVQLTDGMADAISPVWDASGTFLYLLASTDFGLNTGWLDMTSYDRPVTRSLYLVILRSGAPSPFLPRSDEEGASEKNDTARATTDEPKTETKKVEKSEEIGEVRIDLDGVERRIVAAPGLPARDYDSLLAGPEGSVFVTESVPHERGFALLKYTVKDRKAEPFVERATDAVTSHDRAKLLYRAAAKWAIVDTEKGAPKAGDGAIELGGMRILIEPRAEWAQMLRDGWRFMRDFLYVDNVHGAPWDAVWSWYSPWLEDVNHRSDFNHLLDMVSGEVAVGHSYVRGGDYPELTDPKTGLLGADLVEDHGRYRIAKIYTGGSWNPDVDAPLAAPGLDIAAGDYILAIDGRELMAPANPYALLEGSGGRTIILTVNQTPTPDGARRVVVKPTEDERDLRTWAWVNDNHTAVDETSGGRLAYVWLPNTGRDGYGFFNRLYFSQQDRQGAIIDERNNGGGSAADYIVEVLARELTGYFNSKAGDRRPFTQPMAGLFGPKVMIINERAGSGGDLLPYLFRFKGIGPLVGTRTWGGLVGTWDTPPLLDGGRFVAPRGGFFDVNGEWAVEGEGIAPDIEVRNTPKEVIDGRDPQLEAAVEEALRLLETQRVELKPEPPAPFRWRRPDGFVIEKK